jgi:hypothetical protein
MAWSTVSVTVVFACWPRFRDHPTLKRSAESCIDASRKCTVAIVKDLTPKRPRNVIPRPIQYMSRDGGLNFGPSPADR